MKIIKEGEGPNLVISIETDDGKRIPVFEMGPSGATVNLLGPKHKSLLIPRWQQISTRIGFITYDQDTGDPIVWQSKTGLYQFDGEQVRRVGK